ncbi:hypothetical protein ACFYKT_02165 [Cytobacillus sp. FJAT-53684]|uniref:Coupling factor for flagellin transcription and translation n=1 Tax=Cytobacillus mangrovibacter TaxID=3299024 RepID=A0ABW6JTG6_9BACI
MTTFLLLLSLFLNILAFLAIILLFLRQNRLLQVEKKQEKMISDMEEVISAYLVQMKEENEDFINRVKQLEVRSTSSTADHSVKDLIQVSDTVKKDNEPFLHNKIGKANANRAVNVYKQYAKATTKETSVEAPADLVKSSIEVPTKDEQRNESDQNTLQGDSLINQILLLKEQGQTVDKIAQRLNKGKTEIELLLKFQKNQ